MPDITIKYFISRRVNGSLRETPIYTEITTAYSATYAILKLTDRILSQNPTFRSGNIHIVSVKGDNHHGKTTPDSEDHN